MEASSERYKFGDYRMDAIARLLTRDEHPLVLPPKTFDLLALLVKSEGRLLSKTEIMSALWPDTVVVEEANLSFQISTLRKALQEDGSQWIETVPKYGYRFKAQVTPEGRQNHTASIVKESHTKGKPGRKLFCLGVIAISLAAGIALLFRMMKHQTVEDLSPVNLLTTYPGSEIHPSLSPNGSQVAFSWNGPSQDNFDIYVKVAGPGHRVRLTTNPAREDSPVWSTDGRFIAFQRFTSDNSVDLYIIPALGGTERKVTSLSVRDAGTYSGRPWKMPANLAWSPDSKWIAFGGRASDAEEPGIWLIAADGSQERRLTRTGRNNFGDWAPAFAPDGSKLAFLREFTLSANQICVVPLSSTLEVTAAPKQITGQTAIVNGIAWTPDSRSLVFSIGAHLGSSHLERIEIAPEIKPLGRHRLSFGEHAMGVAIARTGELVYAAETRDANIWQMPLNGEQVSAARPLVASTLDEETPDFSPDGKKLAFASTRSGSEEIWISDVDGADANQMTSMGGPQCSNPQWSPDGKQILFNARREGSADLYLLRLDTSEVRRLTNDPAEEAEARWSRDGKTIYFGFNRGGLLNVWKMSSEGGPASRVTKNGGIAAWESFDGRYLYYARDANFHSSICRMPSNGGDEECMIDNLSYSLNFTVSDRGLYYLAVDGTPDSASVQFFDFATRKTSTLMKVGKPFWFGMALAPDRSSLLFSVLDHAGSDLMMVEEFH